MEERVSRPTAREARIDGACRHHWNIEGSSGPVSKGICHLCQETREFRNYIEESTWFEQDLKVQAADVNTSILE